MRIRTALVVVVVVVACTFSATALGRLGGPSGVEDDPGRKRPFIHADHVPETWADNARLETRRDCRGCHVFHESAPRDPQAVCGECHLVVEENQSTFRAIFSEGWETLDQARDPDSLFRHHTHAALACRECHQPEGRIPSDPMPIRRGSAECTRCHGPNETGQGLVFEVLQGEPGLVPDSARQLLLDQLNENPNMLPENLEDFYHSEHLAEPQHAFSLAQLVAEEDRTGLCTSCHEPVIGAGIERLHENRFQRESCGECHISREGRLKFGATVEPVDSVAAMTFSHADHLGFEPGARDRAMSSSRGYERIEEEGCQACHQYDGAARTFVVSGDGTHEGCRGCHTSEDWQVARHGEWQAWECTACHTFDRAGGLALDRPQVTVRRRRATSFIIESQVHPHIAGDVQTDLFEGNCNKCHRARVDELPSRLGTRPFSHATHLAAAPDPQQCSVCHGSRVEQAGSSSAISEFVAGHRIDGSDPEAGSLLGLTYDIRACVKCHRGGMPEPVQIEFEEIAPAEVVDFSHAQHLGKQGPDGAPIDCLACHQPGARGPVGTLPAAMACTQCHDHRSGPSGEISGNASAAELARCSKCHVASIPAAGGTYQVERARLTTLIGKAGQYHPPDRQCNECHTAEWAPFSEADAVDGDHVFAEGGRDASGEHQHRGEGKDGFLRNRAGTACLWCHWTHIEGFDFESVSNRERDGNILEKRDRSGELQTYPGGNYREKTAR